MKRFSWMALAMLVIAGSAMAQPPQGGMQPPQGGMMMHREMMKERMGKSPLEELGLSDAQKTQIHQTLLDTRKKNIDVEAKLKLAGIELHELMRAEAPDQAKINVKISEVSKLRETLMRNGIETKLAVHKILTPEQRKKLQESQASRLGRGRHGARFFGGAGMMHRGGGFGPHDDIDTPEFEEEF